MRLNATTTAAAALEIINQCKRDDATGCLLWGGYATPYHVPPENRHGSVIFNGRQTQTSRIVWEAATGKSAKGTHMGHSCGNNRCQNIDHLYVKGKMPYWSATQDRLPTW